MTISLKDTIALRALTDAPLNGWSRAALRHAAEEEGQPAQMADALFPALGDAAMHISDILDARMMEKLGGIDPAPLRVRDRIATAVQTRLDIMTPYRDGLHVMLAHWSRPVRSVRAAVPVWRSADRIWQWAGDTARDYNRYTKRGLLSGVMASTTLYWLQDNSPGQVSTRLFLDRRIDNVLSVGKFLGSFRKKAA